MYVEEEYLVVPWCCPGDGSEVSDDLKLSVILHVDIGCDMEHPVSYDSVHNIIGKFELLVYQQREYE